MCNQSLFKWWRHLHYWRNNSQRQFEHRKFDANLGKSSSPKLLDKILTNSPWVCVIKVCSNGGAIYIIGDIIAKDNLNRENLKIFFSKTTQQNS